jgi:glutaredoxin
MTSPVFPRPRSMGPLWVAGALLAAAGSPAWALFKVVAPDGTVTYTDRPPSTAGARVAPLRAGDRAPEVTLPPELATLAQRFPVTLMVTSGCAPCDEARTLLRNRGVPHAERTITSDADTAALQRLSGARDLPVLTIGRQVVRGYQEQEWSGYLDAAGYPRASRLPPGYRFEAAVPLATPPVTAAPTPAAVPAGEAGAAGTGTPGFRF